MRSKLKFKILFSFQQEDLETTGKEKSANTWAKPLRFWTTLDSKLDSKETAVHEKKVEVGYWVVTTDGKRVK